MIRVGVSRDGGGRWILKVAWGGWIVTAERLEFRKTKPNGVRSF